MGQQENYALLNDMYSKIVTLNNERELLRGLVISQNEQWSGRTLFFESIIAQMKDEASKTRQVEDAKMRVFVGFKESEALCYKMQLELAEHDLEEFRSCLEAASIELAELKEKIKEYEATGVEAINCSGSSKNLEENGNLTLSLKKEIKKLKHAYKELSSKRQTEVSALLAEKDFVWNQFKKMESDYIALLKTKRTETDCQAKEAAEKIEKLQHEINKKDEIIANLEAEKVIFELDANNKLKELRADMDEQCMSFKGKDELINNLREEVGNLRKAFKENYHKSRNSNVGIMSEGRFKNMLTTTKQTCLQKSSKKCSLKSCDTNTKRNRKCDDYRRATSETASCGDVCRQDGDLTEKKPRIMSPAMLFHSDFKLPRLK